MDQVNDIHGPPAPPLKADPPATKLGVEWKHNSPLLGCRFDPSGRFVFAGAQDNSIQRWEIATGKKTALAGHQSWARPLAFDTAGHLISGDCAGRILWWDAAAETPAPLRTVEAHDGWVRGLAVSPDGKLLASCGNDNLVKLWTIDGKPVSQFAGHTRHVYNVVFHPDGQQLASGDLLGVVKHWDRAKPAAVRDFDASVMHKYDPTFRASIGGARSMTFSADGSQLALAGIINVSNAFAGIGNPAVVLFDWQSGKRAQMLQPQAAFQGTMWGVVHHPDRFWIGAAGGSGGGMWFWKPSEEKAYHMLKLPNNGRDLALHPDGIRLAVPHADGALRLYHMTSRQLG